MRLRFFPAWVAAAALAAGCSSDDFGPTGGGLPADVSQDSLGVELVLQGARDETTVEVPVLGEGVERPLDERQLLYFGGSPVTGWSATPLIRYRFDTPDSVDVFALQAEDLVRVDLTLRLTIRDSERGEAPLRFQLHELGQAVEPGFDGDLSTLLGDTLGTFEVTRGETVRLEFLESAQAPALRSRVLGWIQAGGHNGLALVNASTDSVLIALASSEFDVPRNGDLLTDDQLPAESIIVSRVAVEMDLPTGGREIYVYETEEDWTWFDEPASSGTLALAGHVPSRPWLDFDLTPVPRAATINSAELVLNLDRDRITMSGFPGDETYRDTDGDGEEERSFPNSTLQPPTATVLVYEATRAEAESGTLSGLSRVQNALTRFDADRILVGSEAEDRLLRVNVTDFVQRAVNGLFGDTPPGLLVVLDGEELFFIETGFFDSQSALDLQPRLEVTYTPPADFVD